jgi:predicted RNA-binding protein YlxR (DUF448 family)
LPDGRIATDESGRAAGRGAYVCRDAGCLQLAIDKGALGRALASRIPGDVQVALLASLATPNDSNHMTTPNTDEGGARGQE